jgi:uncharacterized membrane-anchored protein YhcB (DUF1043 family)
MIMSLPCIAGTASILSDMDAAQILAVVIPLIGVLAIGVVVPVFLVQRAERIRRQDNERADERHRDDRDAEWARQDAVAARAAQAADDLAAVQKQIADHAAEAASLLLAKQEAAVQAQQNVAAQAAEAARLLVANNELVARTSSGISDQLGVIHTLVNSNMTAEMQARFDAIKRELAMMREVVELKKANGLEPTPEVLAEIAATEASLHELDAALTDRRKAQDKITTAQAPQSTVTTTTTVRGAGGEA